MVEYHCLGGPTSVMYPSGARALPDTATHLLVGSEDVTTVTMRSIVFWDMMP
jgi:hypothetical protein